MNFIYSEGFFSEEINKNQDPHIEYFLCGDNIKDLNFPVCSSTESFQRNNTFKEKKEKIFTITKISMTLAEITPKYISKEKKKLNLKRLTSGKNTSLIKKELKDFLKKKRNLKSKKVKQKIIKSITITRRWKKEKYSKNEGEHKKYRSVNIMSKIKPYFSDSILKVLNARRSWWM